MEKQIKGEVISIHKTGCYVRMGEQTVFCLNRPGNPKNVVKPVVNDIVVLEPREDKFFIKSIEPRKNFVARYDFYKNEYQGFAANIDVAFVVTSANKEFSVNRIGRFLKLLDNSALDEQLHNLQTSPREIKKVIIVTKIDKLEDSKDITTYEKALDCFADASKVFINAKDACECNKIMELLMPGQTGLLMGSSGVGKSTIINALGNLQLKTNEVQGHKFGNKGRHTTSSRTMYFLPNGSKIIDTPGVKIVGVEGDTVLRR